MTQTQIARRLDVSQMQISRLIRHVIAQLRAAHDAQSVREPVHAA